MRQLGKSTWVLEGPTNIGFYETGGDVILIDSGNDKESGRRINKILKEKGWRLKAVVNTHSNADHIGGNDYLQRNLDAPVWATAGEHSFIERPELETAFLWGGREVKELRNKFFQARPSRVDRILSEEGEIEPGLNAISLKGHFMNMIGLETGDGVLFLADCLFGEEILTKYGIPFIYDVGDYKRTIETVREREASFYVPSHGPVTEDIRPLADRNLALVGEIEETLLTLAEGESSFEEILKGLCDRYLMELNAGQYALVGSTVRSFLSWLHDQDLLDFAFTENRMLWKRR